MYKKLILKNEFHNSYATFRVEHQGQLKVDDIITLSAGQVQKARRLLCGIDTCTCSGELGIRADWQELDGQEVKLSQDIHYNNSTGQVDGASLIVDRIW